MDWKTIQTIAQNKAQELGPKYVDRLEYELEEILKQALNDYWVDLYNSNKKYDSNKNGMVLPFLLGITSVDPIINNIKHNIEYQVDYPDVDIDFLPFARDPIKNYISEKYGQSHVCSVGSWLTYKPRLAIKDAVRALGSQDPEMTDGEFARMVDEILEGLPKELDNITTPYDANHEMEKAINDYPEFKNLATNYPKLIDMAYRMVTRVKTQGKHAGGIIISSKPIGEYVPLAFDHKTQQHISSWTEGFSQQLSKFGFVKFDLLGLRTMWDIFSATELVKKNKNIEIDWTWLEPAQSALGRYREIGSNDWKPILMNDAKILDLCKAIKVETVFQFETDFAMGILKQVGVKNFWDIAIATSLGRPGPMEQIPSYIENRDDSKKRWKIGMPDKMVSILEPTNAVIVFQEQLSSIWTDMCGLSVPEAEKARKAVAKKKASELLKLEPKIINGLAKYKDEQFAREWWYKMTKFGQYAFNKSHTVAYSIISWRCLFLKAYFPAEWWASVMSHAKPDKRAKYVGLARLDNIKFGVLDINDMAADFSVRNDEILPGLSIIKGIGEKASARLACGKTHHDHIDKFMQSHTQVVDGKITRLVNKSIMLRLIKLGGFDKIHKNRRALWWYYIYKYAGNDELKKKIIDRINQKIGWTDAEITHERELLIADWRRNQTDKSKLPPARLTKWKPKQKEYKLEDFESVVKKDYSLDEILANERKYFGFYWHSPLDLYIHNGNNIAKSKTSGTLECVIQSIDIAKNAKGNDYLRIVVTDGLEEARLMVFGDQIGLSDQKLFNEGVGIRVEAQYNSKFRSFTCKRNTQILALIRKDAYNEFHSNDENDDENDDDYYDVEYESENKEGLLTIEEIEQDVVEE